MPADDKLLTLAEAMSRLGVTRSLLYHYYNRGLLSMAWDTKHKYHLVRADEVEALRPYLKRHRATPSSD